MTLESSMDERQAARGRAVFWEGEPFDGVWVLKSGRIHLLHEAARSGRFTLREAVAGDCLELPPGLASGGCHRMTARVEEPAFLWRVPVPAYVAAFAANGDFARACARWCERRLAELELLHPLLLEDAATRLGHRLLALSDRGRLPVKRCKRELAALSGSSQETVFRLLRNFRRRGWVRSEGGAVFVADVPGLERATGGRA